MNLIKTADGKQALKLTKADWIGIGKQAGWFGNSPSKAPVQKQIVDPIVDPDAEAKRITREHFEKQDQAAAQREQQRQKAKEAERNKNPFSQVPSGRTDQGTLREPGSDYPSDSRLHGRQLGF